MNSKSQLKQFFIEDKTQEDQSTSIIKKSKINDYLLSTFFFYDANKFDIYQDLNHKTNKVSLQNFWEYIGMQNTRLKKKTKKQKQIDVKTTFLLRIKVDAFFF